MDGINNHTSGGRLQISVDAIEKIARHATMEIDGVKAVKAPALSGKSFLDKIVPLRPIEVQINNDVADIQVSIIVRYGARIPELCESVQKNVKNTVQNMTGITVGRVDIVVSGVIPEEAQSSDEY